VEYYDKVVGVRVTLDGRANDGTPGEGDDIGRGVLSVWGTDAGDVLDARGATGIADVYGNAGPTASSPRPPEATWPAAPAPTSCAAGRASPPARSARNRGLGHPPCGPPDSARTMVRTFRLGDDCPAGHDGEAVCPPPSPPPKSSTPPR
jgi:hypothetical protein